MQVQEKNIKGFNLLELIVVMVIVGIVSAVAYPNFSDWRKEREVRQGVAKIQSLIKNIYTQTERGTFAFVQVLINPTDTHIFIESKGMTMQTLASKINNSADPWNGDLIGTTRCDTTSPSGDTSYWDTDKDTISDDIKDSVYSITFTNVTTNFEGTAAVCFSRNGKFYEANAGLLSNSNKPYDFIYICRRVNEGEDCNVGYSDSDLDKELPPGTDDEGNTAEYLNAIKWSRFGNFAITKWSGSDWIE